ncbi:MAG: T9SS type A sorting domain-containing protein [Bacteroidetes bacterium]|nr:T9SS type A sorting domain-containing protein [Bacteroidota bacterium]
MKKILLIILFCSAGFVCRSQALYTIPIVVHVMHTGEPLGDSLNPTDETIRKSIIYMNKVFSGESFGADEGAWETNIRFALAKRDAAGFCTEGITRHNLSNYYDYDINGIKPPSTILANATLGLSDEVLKSIVLWYPSKYINIYLVKKINGNGLLEVNNIVDLDGYTTWLANNALPNTDGIVIKTHFIDQAQYINVYFSIKSMLSHEMGHMLKLAHVFEDGCIGLGFLGDFCDDTKRVTKWQNQPRTGPNLCYANFEDYDDYTERNIMSYTTEPLLFTPDQKARMLGTLQDVNERNSLINGNNALIPPIADLTVNEPANLNKSIPESASPRTIVVQYKETNIGDSIAGSNFISFHLSADSILTPGANGDTLLGDTLLASINGLSSTALLTKQLSIPGGYQIGEYYIFISADGAQGISECSEENNFATAKLYIVDTNAIAQYRYWFDDNFANAQNGFAGYNNISDLQFELPVTQLSKGVHQFNIMFKETGAGWSSISSSLFYKPQLVVNGSSKFQYWFDDNFAGAYTQNIQANDNYSYSSLIDVSQLGNGVHTVHYRFLTYGQTWSVINSTLFYKMNSALTGINTYQYWFDNNIADSVTVNLAAISHLDLLADINIPNGFLTGNHAFNIRYKQDGGLWSVVQSDSFFSCNVIANVSSNIICNGENVTLYGSGALSYIWTAGVLDNVPFYPNATQTYTVTGTTANGCVSTSTTAVQVKQTSATTTNASICINQVPYLWNGLSISSPGTYNVTFVNAVGCDSIATLVLNISLCGQCQPTFTVNWTPYTEPLTESQNWIITSGTVLVPVGSNVKFDANSTGYVTLNPGFKADYGSVFVAQAYNGCTPGAPQLPNAKIWNGIEPESDEIILYPNPTSGMIHITHDTKVTEILVFDMVGKLLIQHHCESETISDIDLSQLPNGVYHVKVKGYNSIKVVKNN